MQMSASSKSKQLDQNNQTSIYDENEETVIEFKNDSYKGGNMPFWI